VIRSISTRRSSPRDDPRPSRYGRRDTTQAAHSSGIENSIALFARAVSQTDGTAANVYELSDAGGEQFNTTTSIDFDVDSGSALHHFEESSEFDSDEAPERLWLAVVGQQK